MGNASKFYKWLNTAPVKVGTELRWKSWFEQQKTNPNPSTPDELKNLFDHLVIEAINNQSLERLDLPGRPGDVLIEGKGPEHSYVRDIRPPYNVKTKISNIRTRLIRAQESSLELRNVWADELQIVQCNNVTLVNCFIGTLIIKPQPTSTFEMRGGGVLCIDCPSPGEMSPFTGSVFFDNKVFFAKTPNSRLKGPQPYRNMRSHMAALQNTPMANIFHRLEQSTERKMDGYGFARLISALYEYISDYGSSVGRPALYFIALMIFTFVITLCLDGATYASSDEPYGWQQSLIGSDYEAQLIRSLVITGQATLNPLGVFATKVLLVAKTGFLAF